MRIMYLLVVFSVSFCAVSWLSRPVGQATQQISRDPISVVEVQQPNPDRLPEEVVRLQVDALQRFATAPEAIEQCYVLASPTNRAVTGPLDRFAMLVLSPGYRVLVTGDHPLIGKSIIRNERASVLVTVLNEKRVPVLFRFFLSKQSNGSHSDCWMTDAVIAIQSDNPTEQQALSDPNA